MVEQALLAQAVPNSLAGLGRDLEAFGGDLEAWHRDLLRSDVDAAALARQFLAVKVSFLMMRVVVAPAACRDDEAGIAALAKVFATGAGAAFASGGLP